MPLLMCAVHKLSCGLLKLLEALNLKVMRQAHRAVTQAATEAGLAESALQHPSELGLRHTFTALEMGKRVETVRSASARDEARSAYAHTLMNHDMPEPQNWASQAPSALQFHLYA